ncbi:hypothetical protein HDU67_004861 [Dinochytrium kinnereticum]|nr:hypothetical protein HDU67_004861 [Dinochytrium kinnereticum]
MRITDDAIHHLVPWLDRRDLATLRLIDRQWSRIASQALMATLSFSLYKNAEPKTVAPFHALHRRSSESLRAAANDQECKRKACSNLERIDFFFDCILKDVDQSDSLMWIRELDLTGLSFLPPHATDGWFSADSGANPLTISNVKHCIHVDAAASSPSPLPAGAVKVSGDRACHIVDLSSRLPILSTLKLRSVDLAIVLAILSSNRNRSARSSQLRRLEISHCHAPMHGSMEARRLAEMAAENGCLDAMSKLTSISTSTCGSTCERCHLPGTVLSDVLGPALGSSMRSITFGDFGWSSLNEKQEAWKLSSRCANVQELLMVGQFQPFSSFESMSMLFSAWKHLTAVSFSYYSDVNDAIVATLATTCPNLQHLSLLVVTYDEITDTSILSIAKGCPRLKSLLLHPGTRPSDGALLTLILSLPLLESLQLPGAVTEPVAKSQHRWWSDPVDTFRVVLDCEAGVSVEGVEGSDEGVQERVDCAVSGWTCESVEVGVSVGSWDGPVLLLPAMLSLVYNLFWASFASIPTHLPPTFFT